MDNLTWQYRALHYVHRAVKTIHICQQYCKNKQLRDTLLWLTVKNDVAIGFCEMSDDAILKRIVSATVRQTESVRERHNNCRGM